MPNIKGVKTLWEKYKVAGIVTLMGVVLLLWPSGSGSTPKPGGESSLAPAAAVEDLQKDMEQTLALMEGVGQVRVLLSLEQSGEAQLAQDGELSYRGDTAAPEDYAKRWQVVIEDGPVVTGQTAPVYRGALVVCQGGGQPKVRLAVTEAVTALTGLSADRVTVAKWQ